MCGLTSLQYGCSAPFKKALSSLCSVQSDGVSAFCWLLGAIHGTSASSSEFSWTPAVLLTAGLPPGHWIHHLSSWCSSGRSAPSWRSAHSWLSTPFCCFELSCLLVSLLASRRSFWFSLSFWPFQTPMAFRRSPISLVPFWTFGARLAICTHSCHSVSC